MSKTISTILVTALVIAAAVLFINKKPTATDVAPNGMTQTTTDANGADYQPNQSGKKMAFDVFLAQGGTYECTVHQYVNDTDTTGKVWIDGAKLHGKFSTMVQGKSIDSNFSVLDGYTYAWASMSTMGFKMKNKTDMMSGSVNTPVGTYSWDAKQIGDYDCSPWTSDAATFAIPANIKFTEMAQ